MKGEDRNLPLELGDMMRQGFGYIIENTGKIIALITVVVATLVTFTDISFSELSSVRFTSSLAVMLVSSYLMYFSLEDAGEKYAEGCEEYKRALLSYKSAREKIHPDAILELGHFCSQYIGEELEYRRNNFLLTSGYSVSEFEDYKRGEPTGKKALRVFKRAEKIKPIQLSVGMLLSGSAVRTRGELNNPEREKFFGMLLRMLPSTICTFFTASVILTTKDNLTASTVIEGILKLSTLPIVGFKGYQRGYLFVKENKSAWIEAKTRILEAFIERGATVKEKP